MMTEAVGQASAKFVAGLWSRINSLVLVIRGYRIRGEINRAEEKRILSTEKIGKSNVMNSMSCLLFFQNFLALTTQLNELLALIELFCREGQPQKRRCVVVDGREAR